MNTKEQILQMVKDGTITVDEGVQLLTALESKVPEQTVVTTKRASGKRMLRIIVDSDEDKVRVNIPLSLAKLGLKLGMSDAFNVNGKELNLQGIDLDEIVSQIDDESQGEIATVETEDGETVRIFID